MVSTYKKLRKLGSGGFGEVWMAERNHDKRKFALKYLLATDSDSIAPFQREVRCLSRLDHPNIVRITSTSLTSAPFWYAMPPYDHCLYDELASIAGAHERIYAVFRSILDSIRYAYGQGIIHRDLKPENVLMNSDDDLVVSDFGLGRVLDSKTTRKTATGTRLGTFLYCSPEQMMDFKRADHRSDIFSLGRMLYELYTGELTSAIQDLSSVPALIAPIVERATATNPDNRYPTVDKMLGEFDGAMEVMLGVVESGSLSDLVEKLRAAPSWSDEEITRLIKALEDAQTEDDVIHEGLMKIPPALFARVAARSRSLARGLILKDAEMRADLLTAAIVVGYTHSRYYVMGVAAKLVEAAKGANELAAFAKVLKEHSDEISFIGDYVDRSELHPSLRHFFPKPK